MAKLSTGLAAFAVSSMLGGAAFAQAAPITGREVIGDWLLAITPAERQGLRITVESQDGGELDFPLTVRARADGGLACVARARPAECRIEDGDLVVILGSGSGGARMTFTLADRTREGFSGTARLRLRLLPIGGHIGSVAMRPR